MLISTKEEDSADSVCSAPKIKLVILEALLLSIKLVFCLKSIKLSEFCRDNIKLFKSIWASCTSLESDTPL